MNFGEHADEPEFNQPIQRDQEDHIVLLASSHPSCLATELSISTNSVRLTLSEACAAYTLQRIRSPSFYQLHRTFGIAIANRNKVP